MEANELCRPPMKLSIIDICRLAGSNPGVVQTKVYDLIRKLGLVLSERSASMKQTLAVFAALGCVGFLANFVLCPFFGIYEDDYTEFIANLSFSRDRLLSYVQWCFSSCFQGRPLGWMLNGVLGYLSKGDALTGGYLIGWLILTLNGLLIFLVLKRVIDARAAFIGALTYLLLPMDLSKQILMHRAFVHLSVTCLCLGLFFYVNREPRSKILSYLVASLSLIIWEGPYIAFLVAPVLESRTMREKIRNSVIHLLVFPIPILTALLLRYFSGEPRVTEMANSGGAMLWKMVQAMIVGPWTGLLMLIVRPVETLGYADAASKLVGLLAILFCAGAFTFLARTATNRGNQVPIVWMALSALVAMSAPYILMYRPAYFPPNTSIGRLSAVHAGATLGYSLLTATIASALIKLWPRASSLWQPFVWLYFGLLVAFGFHVQETEYAEGWNAQKFIWQRLIAECSDVTEGGTILLDINGLPASQMFSSIWVVDAAGGEALSQFVQFPRTWKRMPELNALYSWCQHSEADGFLVLQSPSWDESHWSKLTDGNFIFLRYQDGDIHRIVSPVTIFGKELVPKAITSAPALQLTTVGRQIFAQKTSNTWPFYRKAGYYPSQK